MAIGKQVKLLATFCLDFLGLFLFLYSCFSDIGTFQGEKEIELKVNQSVLLLTIRFYVKKNLLEKRSESLFDLH